MESFYVKMFDNVAYEVIDDVSNDSYYRRIAEGSGWENKVEDDWKKIEEKEIIDFLNDLWKENNEGAVI